MTQTPAQIVLEAARVVAESDIQALRHLVAHNVATLNVELVLRILLTYLPESTEPSLYTPFLRDLVSGSLSSLDEKATTRESTANIPDAEARRRVRKLHLLPLTNYTDIDGNYGDILTRFLINRAHRIDSETGGLPLLRNLLEPFLNHSQYLRIWTISTLLPLLRLNYEYYPNRAPTYSLKSFEALQGSAAVSALLSEALREDNEQHDIDLGRDLRCLVGPWMCGQASKRRKLSNNERRRSKASSITNAPTPKIEGFVEDERWNCVNQWLLELSLRDFNEAVKAIVQWSGPRDVDYGGWNDSADTEANSQNQDDTQRYGQAGLAAIYASQNTSSRVYDGSYVVVHRVAELLDMPSPSDIRSNGSVSPNTNLTSDFVGALSPAHLLHNELLRTSNSLTWPSEESLELASISIHSAQLLQSLGFPLSTKSALSAALFGDLDYQKDLLRRTLHALRDGQSRPRDDETWRRDRENLLWLRDWRHLSDHQDKGNRNKPLGVFCQIGLIEFEIEVLRMLLAEGRNKLAITIYCDSHPGPIPLDQVERATSEVAFGFYDSASNGNRYRGGVKKASDIVAIFQPRFPNSATFQQMTALLRATHALSFYSLTLQHGVPFQPVNIRSSADALNLVDKVFKQNPRSYTKLEDLLDIGRNLVKAGLIKPKQNGPASSLDSLERQSVIVERRIVAKAIEAALAEGDFDTAYSYVVNRLTPSAVSHSSSPKSLEAPETIEDDVTWHAAYQAGRSRTKGASDSSELRRLEQRMELLSQAMLLAPSQPLREVLATWRGCEEELNELLAQESDEDSGWNGGGEALIPGGFSQEDIATISQKPREPTRNAMNEEAPMGLFDVARGAASAFSKTAFPLRSPRLAEPNLKGIANAPVQQPKSLTAFDRGMHEGEGRLRKRDMVSNMVTGGLASGIGWVLGAPSVREEP